MTAFHLFAFLTLFILLTGAGIEAYLAHRYRTWVPLIWAGGLIGSASFVAREAHWLPISWVHALLGLTFATGMGTLWYSLWKVAR